ncbi:MAG: putative bifunctional diguanylate cyclase/phosphodiesterase [Solirubrobacteraceae bacterium]
MSSEHPAPPGFVERWIWGGAHGRLIGTFIVALGLGITAFLVIESHSSAAQSNKEAFRATADDLSTAVASKLENDIALTRTMRAIATLEPRAGESRFRLWYQELQRDLRPTEGVVATLIQPVPASGLAAYRRQAESDPTFRTLLAGKALIFPAGRRPVYCLNTAIVGTASVLRLAKGLLDYCAPNLPGQGASPYPGLIRTATDTGTFVLTTVPQAGGHSIAALGIAVYRHGAFPTTLAARRAAMTGTIGTSFDSTALMDSVLAGRSSLTLALYHQNIGGPEQLIGRAGTSGSGRSTGYSMHVGLGDGFTVAISGTAAGTPSITSQVLIALGGLLMTLLLFLLYLVLSRSRSRAWTMVGEKTGELEYSSLHDPLTDLPNRELVMDRAEQILARARRLDTPSTALFVDIDGFKQINDRLGHQVGDEVLRQVGARLKTVLRDNDTIGRLGGDEFVMLIDSLGLNAAPELVAERILDVLRQPIALSDPKQPSISITASIGVATGRPVSAEALLADADLALYKAKALGKNGFVKFESAMQTAAQDRRQLETDLTAALEAEQFFLVYQPMLDLDSERVVGVEALIRWRHSGGDVIPPDLFIPLAEDTGLIVPIGRWVLEQACAQAAEWQARGHDLNISVNVSARQLERSEFVEEVRAALRHSALDPETLTLEITETVLMRNPDATAELLTELKTLGVRIAVDDFGTGYSSLAYLRQFPVDSLKIDRTFITGLALSSEAHALTHTLIQLGKALGLQTLAEGVEDHTQVRELQREGCDLAQGFLFARPLAADVVESFLRDRLGLSRSFAA